MQHTATHRSTLQHIAAHCSTLQHIAAQCSTVQQSAAHCNTLQHTATHCNTLQHTATHCNATHPYRNSTRQVYYTTRRVKHCNTQHHTATLWSTLQHPATHYNKLQHTATHCILIAIGQDKCSAKIAESNIATHCNTLQHTATHCNTLQHTATLCSTLQRILIATGRDKLSTKPAQIKHCNTLQHTATYIATHFNTHILIVVDHDKFRSWTAHSNPVYCTHLLQHTARHCNTLHIETHWNTLKHTHANPVDFNHVVLHLIFIHFHSWSFLSTSSRVSVVKIHLMRV